MRVVHANSRTAKAITALGVAASLAAGGVAVSGCGSSETLDPVALAAEVSSQQAGARISLTMQLSSPELPSGYAITANGFVDERDRSGEISMDLSGIPGASSLPEGGMGTVKMIYQYPVVYMDMPFLSGKLPEGKTWIELDIAKAAQAAGINLSQLSSLGETDPTQFLDYLRASSGDVTAVGSESLDGVPTTHYRATLQLSQVLERLPASEQAAAKAGLEKLGEDGAIPVDVWVDKQGRVRRMQMSIDAGGATSATTPTVSGTITINFSSYGPVPAIVPPPASQVFDATALATAGITQAQGG
jgi:hypothetical protein